MSSYYDSVYNELYSLYCNLHHEIYEGDPYPDPYDDIRYREIMPSPYPDRVSEMKYFNRDKISSDRECEYRRSRYRCILSGVQALYPERCNCNGGRAGYPLNKNDLEFLKRKPKYVDSPRFTEIGQIKEKCNHLCNGKYIAEEKEDEKMYCKICGRTWDKELTNERISELEAFDYLVNNAVYGSHRVMQDETIVFDYYNQFYALVGTETEDQLSIRYLEDGTVKTKTIQLTR